MKGGKKGDGPMKSKLIRLRMQAYYKGAMEKAPVIITKCGTNVLHSKDGVSSSPGQSEDDNEL